MKYLIALLTLLTPTLLFANDGNVRVNGRVQLRADVDVPFSADATIPAPVETPPAPPAPGPVTTSPPVYQYEQAPTYQYAQPAFQARVRYRLRVRPAFYYQPYVTYEPAPIQFSDPCLTGGFLGAPAFGGLGRERIDIRYRYRSGW